MRISIAMCTYNGARYLERQFDSMARQTLPPYELIICDDGSTDATMGMIQDVAATAKFPVRVIRNERNLGSTKNFERAIGMCSGDLIALADQDDEWCPHKLETMHRLFEELPEARVAFSDGEIIDDDSARTGRRLWTTVFFAPKQATAYVDKDMVSTLLRLDYIATGATMMFRSEFRSRFTPIPASWPHDAWIAWVAALHGGLAPLPESTIRYRVHRKQQIGLAPASFSDRLAIAKKNGMNFRLIAERLEDVRSYLQRQGKELQTLIPQVDAKIRHLKNRASLCGSLLHRAYFVFSSRPEYQRYTRGLPAMVYDALFIPKEGFSDKAA